MGGIVFLLFAAGIVCSIGGAVGMVYVMLRYPEFLMLILSALAWDVGSGLLSTAGALAAWDKRRGVG